MRRLSSLIAIFVLLAAAAPALACVTAGTMSREQAACCRVMHGNCGEMVKQGCCRTELHTGVHPQLAAAPADPSHVHWSVVAWLSPLATLFETSPRALLRSADAHAPPGARFASTTILRI